MKFNLHYIGYGLAALVLAGLALAWHRSEVANATKDATQAANKILIQQSDAREQKSQSQIEQLTAAMKQLGANQIAMQAQIDKKYQQAKTPQQQATVTAQNLGVSAEQVKATPTEITAPAPQFMAYQQACETCTLNLKVATQQLNYSEQIRQQQVESLSAKDQKIGALQSSLDSANDAAKGGSFLRRFAKGLKVVACAAAGAAAGGASGKGAIPAAVGAGAGAVACSLF